MKILIVDDDPAICQMLQRILKADGHTILTAPDGPQALQLLQQQSIDYVFLDYHLGDVEATDVLDEWRARGPHPPVVVMSGLGEQDAIRKVLEHGARHVIEKPFDISLIRQLIRGS